MGESGLRLVMVVLVLTFGIAGCDSATDSSTPQGSAAVIAPKPSVSSPIAVAPAPTPAMSPRYVPNFSDREDDTYFYAAVPSDEDRKKGKVLGSVVSVRYLGERNGRHQIASVNDAGRRGSLYECSKPCRIIKRTFLGETERIPYDTRSVIGGAFEDALNGSLRVARSAVADQPPREPVGSTIPAAFIGEWNADPAACGTGNSETRLRIAPKRVRFYESDGDVRRVTILNPRSIKVSASFAGEGQAWSDEVEFVLSRSGDDLSSGELTRRRCPPRTN